MLRQKQISEINFKNNKGKFCNFNMGHYKNCRENSKKYGERLIEKNHYGKQEAKININKRGQEEMVGFVLIMVVVAVVFLVFLGIFVRQRGNVENIESTEVAQFLDAVVDVTSECSLNGGFSFLTVSELIRKCVEEPATICNSDQESVCSVLKETLYNLTRAGWNFGAGSVTKGFDLVIYRYDAARNSRDNIYLNDGEPFQIGYGTCGARSRGADKLLYLQGTIIIEMDLCI